MTLIEKAKQFAINAHGDQKYGKMPYAYHLQQVVSKLIMWRDFNAFPITDQHIAVAWLHDVLEDTDTLYCVLHDRFGEGISVPVRFLSKGHDGYNYDAYIARIKFDPLSRLVKMADTLCNLEASLLSGELKRVNKYAKQLALLTG